MVKLAQSASTPSQPMRDLLIIEDDKGLQHQMRWAMSDEYIVHLAQGQAEALEIMSRVKPYLVLLDLGLPPDATGATEGIATLERITEDYPTTKTIVASGNADRVNAMKAISVGAYDFFSKPVDIDELKLILDRAWHLHLLEEDIRQLRAVERGSLVGIVAASKIMLGVCTLVERVAPTDVSILIHGESGTGKEVVVRALHGLSQRARGPLITVNCAAIPDALLESELFGHERGSFTGAIKQTCGKVEQANGGTLFLDEIGDMPLPLQAKLLRFLQSHTLQRVGGSTNIVVDIRVIAATHRDLADMVEKGTFRKDLLFRLNEIKIVIPPLRSRDGDALLIAESFLKSFAKTLKKGDLTFSPAAVSAITNYGWPGNVRELENRIKRAVVLGQGPEITAADLDLASGRGERSPALLKEARQRAETRAIERALVASGNNLSHAAKALKISRPVLYGLLKTYGIRTPPR